MSVKMTAVTKTFAVPFTDPRVAVMVACPALTPVDTPVEPIVATAVADELQVTAVVRFCWVPSLKVPVAVNC